MRGYTMTKQQYLARLRRIEGQVLGLQRQIEEDTYCIDVLQQIAKSTARCRTSQSACSTNTSATCRQRSRRR